MLAFSVLTAQAGQTEKGGRLPSPKHTVFLPAVERSAVYLVAPGGSDGTGDGSAQRPWATIAHAVAQVEDGATIAVAAGTYYGQVALSGHFPAGITVRAAMPYRTRLVNDDTVVTCFRCAGITLEGFEITHTGPGAGRYLVQIQDTAGDGSGGRRVTLRNNIIHDSFNNDLVKVNSGAAEILIQGNSFYNMGGPGLDSHLDINSATAVVVEDNIFFNDFPASGRANGNNSGSYIVVKDSNGAVDAVLGSRQVTIRRNVFLNWQGDFDNAFVVIGEDAVSYYQAYDVLVENNLMLGNSRHPLRAAFHVRGSKEIVFRHNTVSGDLPAKAFALRLSRALENPPNENVAFYNNVWSDPTGTMGAEAPSEPGDFSDARPADTVSFTLLNNLYWNGGRPIPRDPSELVNYDDDPAGYIADPKVANPAGAVAPVWRPGTGRFAGGATTIRDAFLRLVHAYGVPAGGSAVVDSATPGQAAAEDILQQPRPPGFPDVGAVEVAP